MENNLFVILFSLGNLICAAIAVTVSLRRAKSQGILDGTQSIKNLQSTVESMQEQHNKDRATWEGELKKERIEKEQIRAELDQIKLLLADSKLEMRISVGIGGEPKLIGYAWGLPDMAE